MKKIIPLFILLLSFSTIQGQVEDRAFRFGVTGAMGTAFNMSTKTNATGQGLGFSYAYGMQLEFYFSDVIGLRTGASLYNSRAKIEYKAGNPTIDDDDIYLLYPVSAGQSTTDVSDIAVSRTMVINAINVPLIIKAKTPEIGYLTYFIEFGLDNDFAVRSFSTNNIVLIDNEEKELKGDSESFGANKEVILYRGGLNIGIGTEYNLVGSTSIFGSINWSRPLLRTYKKESTQVYYNQLGDFKQDLRMHRINLTVGILF